jgi:predicted acylesterase/phospholipase RssA
MASQNFPFLPIRRGAVVFLLGAVSLLGCQAHSRRASSGIHQANYPPIKISPPTETPSAGTLADALAAPAEAAPAKTKPLNILAVPGGVVAAPFQGGVLVGWSESGTRPAFDVVTGVSSGALIGIYAYLGPNYDARLQRLILTLTTADIIKVQPVRSLKHDGAFGTMKPAERLIASETDPQFMADLRQAHAEGRRFYVGTTELSTLRLVVWDVGAIASSGRPDADELVRKILLASMSWPGFSPPVAFDVEVNGRVYHEEHCDGGMVAMTFIRISSAPQWPEVAAQAKPELPDGSNLYVLPCRKLYSDPKEVKKRALSRLGAAISGTLQALNRADILGLYAFCMATGTHFHMLPLPQDFKSATSGVTDSYPKEATELFQLGHDTAAKGPPWRLTPPGAEPGEESAPRE